MKKYISIFLSAVMALTSCSYLDISPDLGLSEEDVFTKYKEFKAFLDAAYNGTGKTAANYNQSYLNLEYGSFPLRMDSNAYRYTFCTMTDIADAGRQNLRSQTIKLGVLGENNAFVDDRMPIFQAMFRCIRVANMCLEKIDMIQDGTPEEIEDILGQSYFIRAWAHMTLCNYFGGMPYLDHALRADEDFDLPRETAAETYIRAAAEREPEPLEVYGGSRRGRKGGDPVRPDPEYGAPPCGGGCTSTRSWPGRNLRPSGSSKRSWTPWAFPTSVSPAPGSSPASTAPPPRRLPAASCSGRISTPCPSWRRAARTMPA